ncbi:MAG: aminotransferase class V-fold PLP-dependent enzyme [Cyanobacteria bacterium J06635_10]
MNQYKNSFFIPNGIYLLNHSVGCLPLQTIEEKERFFDLWKFQGGEAWQEWLSIIDGFCQSLAYLLNGNKDEFCPQTNISSAVSKILLSLPPRKDRVKLLISEMDFPSIGFAVSQMERLGYKVKIIPSESGTFSLETWKQHLTEDTQLVFITHAIYGNSFLNPVKEIVQYARKQGIFTLVDIAQSVGVVPINLREWNADFVVGSSIKWLCGGPGAGFLWANMDGISQFHPFDVGWFSHENPFEFNIADFRYAKGAKRFWGGTPSVIPYAIAKSSIDAIAKIGVEKIRTHNQALTQILIQAALAKNLTVNTPLDSSRRGGTVAIAFKDSQQAFERFKKENIFIDTRPSYGLRFSPHIYNDREEVEKVALRLEAWG